MCGNFAAKSSHHPIFQCLPITVSGIKGLGEKGRALGDAGGTHAAARVGVNREARQNLRRGRSGGGQDPAGWSEQQVRLHSPRPASNKRAWSIRPAESLRSVGGGRSGLNWLCAIKDSKASAASVYLFAARHVIIMEQSYEHERRNREGEPKSEGPEVGGPGLEREKPKMRQRQDPETEPVSKSLTTPDDKKNPLSRIVSMTLREERHFRLWR